MAVSILKKPCARCKQEKELIDFAKNITAKSGLSCYCIECFSVKRNESGRLSYRKHIITRRARAKLDNGKRKIYKNLWYQKNKARLYEKAKIWVKNNKEKRRECVRRYRMKNLELTRKRCRECNIKKYHENPEKYRELIRKYREKNKELVIQKGKAYRKNMGIGYIAQIIKKGSVLKTKDIPKKVIELSRLNLTLKRLKKEKLLC